MAYKDINLTINSFENTSTLVGEDAIKSAIKNILFSKEGNFYSIPELNVDIRKLLYEKLSESYINQIRNNLYEEILKHIPTLEGLVLDIQKISLDNISPELKGKFGLGISLFSNYEDKEYNIFIYEKDGNLETLT